MHVARRRRPKELKLRMVDEGPGGGGEELVGAIEARRRRPCGKIYFRPCKSHVIGASTDPLSSYLKTSCCLELTRILFGVAAA